MTQEISLEALARARGRTAEYGAGAGCHRGERFNRDAHAGAVGAGGGDQKQH